MKRVGVIFIVVIVLTGSVLAALSDEVTVGTPATIATLWSSGQPYLGIARYKAFIVSGSRIVYMPRAGGSTDPFGLYSDDEGSTWDSATGDMGDEDYHTAGFYQSGVGIHYAFPGGGTSDLYYRLLAEPCTASTDIGSLRILETGNFRATVGARGDTVWVVGRQYDSPYIMSLYWSIDGFATDTNYVDLSSLVNAQDHRIHMAADGNGLMHLFVHEYDGTETGSVRVFDWNGTTFVAGTYSLIRESSEVTVNTRAMTIALTGTNEWHYIYGQDNTLQEYYFDGVDTWELDTISTGTPTDLMWYPHATVRNDSIFLAYSVENDDENSFALKIYDGSTWSDSVMITGSDVVDTYVQMPRSLPDTLNYIPITWNTTGDTLKHQTVIINKIGIRITSLPYTCSVSDTTYYVDSALHSDDQAFIIGSGVHDITINLYDTVYWGEDCDANVNGTQLYTTGVYNVTIDGDPDGTGTRAVYYQNCLEADSLLPDFDLNTDAFRSGGGRSGITIQNLKVRIHGRSAQAYVDQGPDSWSTTFYNVVWESNSSAFDNRSDWIDYAMVAFGSMDNTNMAGFEYHFNIVQCSTVADPPWVNYYFEGDAPVGVLDSTYMTLDARNDYDVVGDNSITGSAEQCYALSTRGGDVGGNIKIRHNTFRSGTTYAGGEAWFSTCNGTDTTESTAIWFYGNDINVNKGNAGADDGGYETAWPIKIRQTASHHVVRSNTISTSADTTGAVTYRAPLVGAVKIEEITSIPTMIIIDSNVIVNQFISDVAPGAEQYAVGLEIAGCDSNSCSTIYVLDNDITAGTYPYVFGNANAEPDYTRHLIVRRDTVAFHDDSTTSKATMALYEGGALGNDNIKLVDCYFDGADETDISWLAGSGDVTIQSTVNFVVDSAGSPCEACSVYVTDAYGVVRSALEVVGADGLVSVVLPWYWASESTDSAGFNDYIWIARQGTDSAVDTLTVGYLPAGKNDTVTVSFSEESPATKMKFRGWKR